MFAKKVISTIMVSPFLGILVFPFLFGALICVISEKRGYLLVDYLRNTQEKVKSWIK